MQNINQINWSPELRLRLKNLTLRSSVDLRILLGVEVVRPTSTFELILTLRDANSDKEKDIEMEGLLTIGYIPSFTISSECFEMELIEENFGNEVYLGALAMMLAEKMRVTIGRDPANRDHLTIVLKLEDFQASTSIPMEEVAYLFS